MLHSQLVTLMQTWVHGCLFNVAIVEAISKKVNRALDISQITINFTYTTKLMDVSEL